MVLLADAHKFPFSLFTEAKAKQHLSIVQNDSSGVIIERFGDVADVMDKSIGRPVLKIKGSVSANNYIDYSGLNLTGRFMHIQLCLLKNIATIHIELMTSNDKSLRLTLSTLYTDKPRNLGACLRIPLPQIEGWMTVILDLDTIIDKYSNINCNNKSTQSLKLKAVKRVQLCSNMLVRDVITSEKCLSTVS